MRKAIRYFLSFVEPLYHYARIAEMLVAYAVGIPHDKDFYFFRNFKNSEGIFIDIGANRGQSAVSFRIFNKSCSIISFEPNPNLENDLKFVGNLVHKHSFHLCGLGKTSEILPLFVPKIGSTSLTQNASLDNRILETNRLELENSLGRPFEIETCSINIRRLDEFEVVPTFIKIDVEGWELSVLEGMGDTLSRHKPIILCEAGKDRKRTILFLERHGYRIYKYNYRSNSLSNLSDEDSIVNFFAIHTASFDQVCAAMTRSK